MSSLLAVSETNGLPIWPFLQHLSLYLEFCEACIFLTFYGYDDSFEYLTIYRRTSIITLTPFVFYTLSQIFCFTIDLFFDGLKHSSYRHNFFTLSTPFLASTILWKEDRKFDLTSGSHDLYVITTDQATETPFLYVEHCAKFEFWRLSTNHFLKIHKTVHTR